MSKSTKIALTRSGDYSDDIGFISLYSTLFVYTVRQLAAVQCIVISPVCGFVCLQRAGNVRTLLQPVCAQCLRLSERFFISTVLVNRCKSIWLVNISGIHKGPNSW